MTLPLAVTVGDPAGIGPEIVLMAASRLGAGARLVAVGSCIALERARSIVAGAPALRVITHPGEARFEEGILEVVAAVGDEPVALGQVSAAAGELAFRSVTAAVRFALERSVAAIVTTPLNKEAIALAGHPYPGHTEILAELTATTDYAMMLTAKRLRVAHVTTHVGVREALERISVERVLTTVRITRDALRRAGIERPTIGVAGINPHAGEHGLFGHEEQTVIEPAVAAAKEEGVNVSGPWPPDTLFARAASGEFDAVVAMFHDQGHIAVKMLGFDSGVNATIGLPIVRTSVDHGTAFDIAGSGTANPESLLEAIAMAKNMSGSS